MTVLPRKLEKEPLLDAICELAVSPHMPLLAMLPGYIHSKLSADVTAVESHPGMSVMHGAGQQFVPQVVRVTWKGHTVSIAEQSVNISSKLPYVGWEQYAADVAQLFQTVLQSKLIGAVNRMVVRYVNLFPKDGQFGAPADALDWSVRLGKSNLERGNCQLRTESVEGDITTIVAVISQAQVIVIGQPVREGLILDISAVHTPTPCPIDELDSKLPEIFSRLRAASKQAFFDSISPETLKLLEPTYD